MSEPQSPIPQPADPEGTLPQNGMEACVGLFDKNSSVYKAFQGLHVNASEACPKSPDSSIQAPEKETPELQNPPNPKTL